MTALICAAIDFDQLAVASVPENLLDVESFSAPGIKFAWKSPHAAVGVSGAACCAALGAPRFIDSTLAAIAARNPAEAWLASYTQHGAEMLGRVHGAYSVAIVDAQRSEALLAVDRFSMQTFCYAFEKGRLSFSDRADAVEHAGIGIDPQGIFDYLYFHMIPAPRTIFRNVWRLPPGHMLTIRDGDAYVKPYWRPRFEEDRHDDFVALRSEFLTLVQAAVEHEIVPGRMGAFLSGGTDSSTVAGMLGKVTGERPRTYSIGFHASGYDEMEYARIAARHFNADHHEHYVTQGDLLAGMPAVAEHHDQPFGNSSALPAYFCARLAREGGVAKMLAGDGGDELFGGNSRYATQRVFELYQGLPQSLRKGVLEPLFATPGGLNALPGLKQISGYVRHSAIPMPDRMQSFNLLLQLTPQRVLQPGFLAQVATGSPIAYQRETYSACEARSLINRMLAFDWKYTIGDSDLPKVRGAAQMAEIDVGYPLLDDHLTDFSLKLRPEQKLKRLKLRWFFKEALRGFLPDAVITKKKHGFGLPFGVWLARHEPLRQLAREALHGAADRGIVRLDFVEDLLDRHLPEHPGYYGELVWVVTMLELWFRKHAPTYRVD